MGLIHELVRHKEYGAGVITSRPNRPLPYNSRA
jgi:hypothetical protein